MFCSYIWVWYTHTHMHTHRAESIYFIFLFFRAYTRQDVPGPKVFNQVSVETKEMRSELADWELVDPSMHCL